MTSSELPAQHDQLARAQSQIGEYRALLNRVPAIIYIADPGEHGAWRYVSPQIELILGFTAEEWCADPGLWSRQLHPVDRERALAEEAEQSALRQTHYGTVEYRMRHRDGRTVWLRDDAHLLSDQSGRLCWHGVLSDITDRKQAEAELERRARQQATVARLGEHALERAPLSDLIQEAMSGATEVLAAHSAIVVQVIPGEEATVLRATIGWPEEEVGRLRRPISSQSLTGTTILTGAPSVVDDWLGEERLRVSAALMKRDIRSSVCVRIDGSDGPWGAFGVFWSTPGAPSPGDIDFIQSLANILADAFERQRVEEAIQHQAVHDPLTGLPNRVLFLDRLQRSLDRIRRHPGSRAAVLFIDIDHFKLVNDSLGHHSGDELLAAVGTRLSQSLRATDTVARFGGDEFGILLDEITTERDAIAMAEQIASVFARPFVLGSNEHFVTTSIGIALAAGGELPQDLIRDADAAMYRAKERGRARYELFDEIMRARVIARLRTEHDLRHAIEHEELSLAYQPIVALGDESIVGVEALLRWNHPTRGQIPPTEFIPVAEETGLIDRIGRFVLEAACRDAAAWSAQSPDTAPLGVSVNLSPLQLAGGDLPAMLAAILRTTGLDPGCLSLEITERLVLDETDATGEALRALRALGVRLVLDDFGTGYSSLSYLTRLPLDALKIDRSFINALGQNARDTAVTEAIIAMGHALSLQVVGEGTETEAQVRELRRLGCDHAQGYLFSRPVPAPEISAMLRESPHLSRTT